MMSYIAELIVDGIITIIMKQRWYLAIAYIIALLSLVVATGLGLLYLASSWLFAPERFAPNTALSVGGLVAAIGLWWGFFALARRTAV
jgi:hypothetical protein